jgi:uncharacterized protein
MRADLLLIGTGDTVQNIDPMIYDYFRQRGMSVEAMATVRSPMAHCIVSPMHVPCGLCVRC